MLKKIVTLLTGSLSAKILQFIYFFWVVKIFNKEIFGQYSVALTVFMIFLNPLLEFGTELIITKESAKQNSKKYYQALYWKLLAFLPSVFVITAIGIKFFQLNIALLLSCSVLVFCRSIELSNAAFLRGRDLSRIESLHLSVSRSISLVFLAVNILFFKEKLSLELIISYQIMGILISFWFVEKEFIFFEKLPKIDFQEIISTLKEGLPLALNSIAWLVYFKIDVLLIGKMINPAQAGLYEIAYKILEVTFILPAVVMAIFFSQLVKSKIIEEYRKKFIQAGVSLLGVGLLVASVGTFMLPIVFPWYFRSDQLEVVQIFNVLGCTIPFVYLANLTTQTLVIQKQSYHYLAITICGAILNLGLNSVLIPKMGVKGAAIATVGTEALIMFFSLFFVLKRFGCQLDKVDNV